MGKTVSDVEIPEAQRAEMLALTAEIDEQTRAGEIAAADATVARSRAAAAKARRSYLVRDIVEGVGLSALTHAVNVERGSVTIERVDS